MCADTLLLSAYTAQKSRLAHSRDPGKRGKTSKTGLRPAISPLCGPLVFTVRLHPSISSRNRGPQHAAAPPIIHHPARICLDTAA